MNKAIASILRDLIIEKQPELVSLAAGLVQTLTRVDLDETNRPVKYNSPISFDVVGYGCQEEEFKVGNYFDMSPDSRKKSMMYFEDGGVQMLKRENVFNYYRSKLRLVFWYNVNYFANPLQASAAIANSIVASLTNNPVNRGNISKMVLSAVSIPINDMNIFNRYSHSVEQHQYFMHPYEALAIDLSIDFAINVQCLPVTIKEPEPCAT